MVYTGGGKFPITPDTQMGWEFIPKDNQSLTLSGLSLALQYVTKVIRKTFARYLAHIPYGRRKNYNYELGPIIRNENTWLVYFVYFL